MRKLLISDVHLNIRRVEQILNSVPYDEVYYLGDFFDNYNDTVEENARTAEWVMKHARNAKRCLGNHDMAYPWGCLNRNFLCPGFTPEKAKAIIRATTAEFWDEFRLHFWVDGWLVSHAGIHISFLNGCPSEMYRGFINREAAKALECLHAGQLHPFLMRGWDRGGLHPLSEFGGLNWLDWDSFKPVPGLNQIVGHTFKAKLRRKQIAGSDNHCIDTALRHFAVITDGHLEIFETKQFIGV